MGPRRAARTGGRTRVHTSPKGRAVRVARGAAGRGSRRRSAGAVQDAGNGVGSETTATTRMRPPHLGQRVMSSAKTAGEEIGPADASGSERRLGRVAGEGEVQRELWRGHGGPRDHVLAQAMVAGEYAVVAGHVEAGRRDQGAKAGEELVGVHVGMGGAAAPGSLERDADAAAGQCRDGVVGEGRALRQQVRTKPSSKSPQPAKPSSSPFTNAGSGPARSSQRSRNSARCRRTSTAASHSWV